MRQHKQKEGSMPMFEMVRRLFFVLGTLAALLFYQSASVQAGYWTTLGDYTNKLNRESRYKANYIALITDTQKNRNSVGVFFPGAVFRIARKAGSQAADLLDLENWTKIIVQGPTDYFFGDAVGPLETVALLGGTFDDEGKLALVLAKRTNDNYDVYAVVNKRRYDKKNERWIRQKGSKVVQLCNNCAAYRIPQNIRLAAGTGTTSGPGETKQPDKPPRVQAKVVYIKGYGKDYTDRSSVCFSGKFPKFKMGDSSKHCGRREYNAIWTGAYEIKGDKLILEIKNLKAPYRPNHKLGIGYKIKLSGATFANGSRNKNIIMYKFRRKPGRRNIKKELSLIMD